MSAKIPEGFSIQKAPFLSLPAIELYLRVKFKILHKMKNIKYDDPQSFHEFGLCVIRNVLSFDEVNEFRSLINKLLRKRDYPRMLFPREILQHPKIYGLAFDEKIVDCLQKVFFGELAYFADFQVQHNLFGGWHTDSGSEIKNAYIQSPDYKFAKCGVYLQKNTYEWGGSVLLTPKGHKYPVTFLSKYVNQKIKNVFQRWHVFTNSIIVDVQPGDMLFFDSRMPHSSTPPHAVWNGKENVTKHYSDKFISYENSKLVFYWDACARPMVNDFLNNAQKRSDSESQETEIYYTDYLRKHFPEDYPDEFVEFAKSNQVHIASLDKSLCRKRQNHFDSISK